MNEIENTKETAGEQPVGTPKTQETIKEPKIKNIYKACALIQNILLGTIIVLVLINSVILFIGGPWVKTVKTYSMIGTVIHKEVPILLDIVISLFGIGLLTGILSIIFGVIMCVLYFINKTNKIKKTLGKKFILRGIIVAILIIIIMFIFNLLIPTQIIPLPVPDGGNLVN